MSGDNADQIAAGGMVNLFLMNEFRDLRKGMESRDETLRISIDSVRDGLSVVASKVDRSQGDVDQMKESMLSLKTDVHSVRSDVDEIMDERKTEQVQVASAWAGPRKVANWIMILGGIAGAFWAMLKFWPAIIAFMAAFA